MTRFARAKGSKASNLKSPEDSTPWEVMKEQLIKAKNETEESKKREEVFLCILFVKIRHLLFL